MWPLCSLRCDIAQNSLALRKTASIGHSKGVPTPVAPSPNRKQAMKTSCCWGRGRVVQVRVSSDLAFQSHGYQFCKEDIVHKSANKVFGGGGSQAGGQHNLGYLWWSLPPSFSIGKLLLLCPGWI